MSEVNIKDWDVEDESFWKSTGKKIANKNLWLSIPALFLSFATWAMWGVIIKYMKDFGYKPDTSLSNGIGEFIKWYKEFYLKEKAKHKGKKENR